MSTTRSTSFYNKTRKLRLMPRYTSGAPSRRCLRTGSPPPGGSWAPPPARPSQWRVSPAVAPRRHRDTWSSPCAPVGAVLPPGAGPGAAFLVAFVGERPPGEAHADKTANFQRWRWFRGILISFYRRRWPGGPRSTAEMFGSWGRLGFGKSWNGSRRGS